MTLDDTHLQRDRINAPTRFAARRAQRGRQGRSARFARASASTTATEHVLARNDDNHFDRLRPEVCASPSKHR